MYGGIRVPWNSHKVNPFFQQTFVVLPVIAVLGVLVHEDGETKVICVTVIPIFRCL
jgi:hypothetical protein